MGEEMKILAIDTSGMPASVALLHDELLEAEFMINNKKTHSEMLLPMMDEMKKRTELRLEDLDAIAVAAGPGSFTGLRIGSATAKGLAMAFDLPIVPVPTCDALAMNLFGSTSLVCPIMDARRSEVYTGIYQFEKESMITVFPQKPMPMKSLLDILNEKGKSVIFTGDGIPVFSEMIKEELKVPYLFAPPHLSRQRAGAVAVLAQKLFREGKALPAAEYAPIYLRQSQAERERIRREKGESTEGRYGKDTHL